MADSQHPADGEPGEAPVVDLFTRRPMAFSRRRAAIETQSILDGSAAVHPVVLFCHIRGEPEGFPDRWRWGQLTLGQGRPAWSRLRLRRTGPSIVIPADVVVGMPRAVYRSELSATSPNPRKAAVVPLQSADGEILIGIARASVETLLAGLRSPR